MDTYLTSMTAPQPDGRLSGPAVAWVRRHPVAAFLRWFFTVGWALSLVPFVATRAFGAELPVPPQLWIVASTWIGLLLPAVALTWLAEGPEAVRALRQRTLAVRVGPGWYAVSVFAVAAIAVPMAAIFFGPPDWSPAVLAPALLNGLLLQAAVGLFTTNLWEEVAWMGFIQARLQARHGALLAAVLTAPLFVLQHLALLLENGASLVVVLPVMVALAIPFRATLGWLYNRTGSLFLVGLLHAAGNAVSGGSGFGDGLLRYLYDNSGAGALHVLAEAVLGLGVIAFTRARLGAPPRTHRDRASRAG